MPPLTAGWAARLQDVLGQPVEEVEEDQLRSLVENGVREDADLDFKQVRYGTSGSEKREFAGDLAAMANDRGGLVVIGIRDVNDVAVELTPVELADGEEGRLRQTAAGNLAPHVPFEVRVVESGETEGSGYYLLSVPPSSLRPHAVRKDNDLRYPRRDGATTRWLSEGEVADMYRDRYRLASDQAERIGVVIDEGLREMDTSEEAFVAVGLVPTNSGSMTIDLSRVKATEEWGRQMGDAGAWVGFFDSGAHPTAGVAARRITLTPFLAGDSPPNWQYAELHVDGSGFACTRLPDPRRGQEYEADESWVLNEALLFRIARCLYLLGRHATQRTGAFGDALVEARVVGSHMRLAFLDFMGFPAVVDRSRTLEGSVVSRHTVTVDALAGRDQDLLAAAHLVTNDLFHAWGSPEVRHVAADGTLRLGYFRTGQGQEGLRRFAEERGVPISEQAVEGEA
jgi:Putative DNA-binding domain